MKEKTHIYDFSPFFPEINEYLSSKKPIIPHYFNESMKKEASEIKVIFINFLLIFGNFHFFFL